MKVYRYWARGSRTFKKGGREWTVACFGASESSTKEAQKNADRTASRMKNAILEGGRRKEYLYSDRPLREEVVEEVKLKGELAAVVTRNAYGCLVLNTRDLMFIDIDNPPKSGMDSLKEMLGGLFGKKKEANADEGRVGEVKELAESLGLGMRVYETANGLRCLVTSRTFDPASRETKKLLTDFGSDELFIRLCRVQESFRARLSPKPWRMKVNRPPYRFPWLDERKEKAYRKWQRSYEKKCDGYSTCRLVGTFGPEKTADGVKRIVELHDRYTCTGKALA